MSENPFGDLPEVTFDDWENATVGVCRRCGTVVDNQNLHQSWHAAIEAAAAGRRTTGTHTVKLQWNEADMDSLAERVRAAALAGRDHAAESPSDQTTEKMRATIAVALNQPRDTRWIELVLLVLELQARPTADAYNRATAELEKRRQALVALIGADPATSFYDATRIVERDRERCAEQHAGVSPGEVNRLRRVESALVELGAPAASERDDPGGPMIAWVKNLISRAGERPITDDEYVRMQGGYRRELNILRSHLRVLLRDFGAPGDVTDSDVRMVQWLRAQLVELERLRPLPTQAEQAVTIHHDSAIPEGWQQEIKSLVMEAWATAGIGAEGLTARLVHLVQHWQDLGKVHTCEAHCTLPHETEGEAAPLPSLAERIAEHGPCQSRYKHTDGVTYTCAGPVGHEQRHGGYPDARVTWTDEQAEVPGRAVTVINPGACADRSVWKGCARPKGHTGGHSTYLIGDDPGARGLAELAEQVARDGESVADEVLTPAEPCPSLYLFDGTLLACTGHEGSIHWAPYGTPPGRVRWHDSATGVVPVPWPKDQIPPDGINILHDLTFADDDQPYLIRVTDEENSWFWSDTPTVHEPGDGGTEDSPAGSWQDYAGNVDGDLHVMRP